MLGVASDREDLQVDPVLFERALRFEAEVKTAIAVRQMAEMEWQLAAQRHADQMRQIDAALKEAELKKNSALEAIEAEYSIKRDEWAYNLEAGTLRRLPQS